MINLIPEFYIIYLFIIPHFKSYFPSSTRIKYYNCPITTGGAPKTGRERITMGAWWVRISAIYFILGIVVGLFMSATIQLQWGAAHAHVNVVGWLSTGLIGVIYAVYPKAGNSRLGVWNFWLYNIGLPILLLSMFMIHMEPRFESWMDFSHIFTFTGGGMVAIGIILFIVNVFKNLEK